MKKIFKRFFIKLLCVALVTVMFSDFLLREMVTNVSAEVNQAKISASANEIPQNDFVDGLSLLSNAKAQTLYVKDVMVITAKSKEDAKKLVATATKLKGKILLKSGSKFSVNAKSLLGVVLAKKLNWDNLQIVMENDYYHEFQQFIKD